MVGVLVKENDGYLRGYLYLSGWWFWWLYYKVFGNFYF